MSATTNVARGDGWELRLGDCLRDEWPECDHVITDPPYSEHVHAYHRTSKVAAGRSNVAIEFDAFDTISRVFTTIAIARVVSRWVLIFTDAESVSEWREAIDFARIIPSAKNPAKLLSLQAIRVGTWHKPDAGPQFSGDRPGQATESVVIAHAPGRCRWNGGGLPAFWSYPVREGCKRIHQTQKPVALLERMLEQFTDAGELVLDPFAGSASSGVAAIRTGRRWIGWERDPEAFEKARRRLEATREQPRLPFDRALRPTQGALAL